MSTPFLKFQKIGENINDIVTQNTTVVDLVRQHLYRCKDFGMKEERKMRVPSAKQAMEKFKMETATEMGVPLKQGYNGDLTSKQAGTIGGNMVRKMVEAYENSL